MNKNYIQILVIILLYKIYKSNEKFKIKKYYIKYYKKLYYKIY